MLLANHSQYGLSKKLVLLLGVQGLLAKGILRSGQRGSKLSTEFHLSGEPAVPLWP